MCGINASKGQGHGCRFTMCHASLNMALLLHKEGLVKTTVPITVNTIDFKKATIKSYNFPHHAKWINLISGKSANNHRSSQFSNSF